MVKDYLTVKTRPKASDENIVYFDGYRITVLSGRLIRVEKNKSGTFCDKATTAVWYRDMGRQDFSALEKNGRLIIKTAETEFNIFKDIEKSYAVIDGKKVKFLNRGNLKGTGRTLDNFDGDTDIKSGEKIVLCDGVVSRLGVAVLDDTNSLILDDSGEVTGKSGNEIDWYVFAYGNDYKEAVKAYYMICGMPPLLPRYALGNWWSRYYPYSERAYYNLIEKFEKADIPLTVATVDMDWHYSFDLDRQKGITASGRDTEFYGYKFDEGWKLGWTGYSWNKELFPDYKRFLENLHKRNLKIALNVHPADGVRYFEDCYGEMAAAMGVDAESGRQIKFDFTDSKFINAYFEVLHHPYEKDGVDVWWIDWQQGTQSKKEGLDPLWALNHYHYLNSLRGGNNIILSRFSGTGGHRYPLGFSGDTVVSWETLNYLPYFTATASNIGYTWWSHDIGGHMLGYKDDELYVRFIQFGVFSPINRLHSTSHEMLTKEPWAYANGAGLIAAEYLRLRHKMLPFLHSCNYCAARCGEALIEPMYYYHPQDKNAYVCRNQYYFGGQLIVAPVTKKSDNKYKMAQVKVWLPQGKWTDIFSGEVYRGNRVVNMVRWLDGIPALAKEGSILVFSGDELKNGAENPRRIEIWYFDGNGSFELFENKGDKEAVTLIKGAAEGNERRVYISFKGDRAALEGGRDIKLVFKNNTKGEIKVQKNNKDIKYIVNDEECVSILIENFDFDGEYCVTLECPPAGETELLFSKAKYCLLKMEGDNGKRTALYDKILNCKSADEYKDAVLGSDIPQIYKKKLLE